MYSVSATHKAGTYRKIISLSTLISCKHLKPHNMKQILLVTISMVHAALSSFAGIVELSLQLPEQYHMQLFLQQNHTARYM